MDLARGVSPGQKVSAPCACWCCRPLRRTARGAVRSGPLGVNIGPTLTHAGLLAALLRRRIVRDRDSEAESGECVRLVLCTVPAAQACLVWALGAASRMIGARPDAEGGSQKGSG